MRELPAGLEALRGDGPGYVLAAACVVALLFLSRLSAVPAVRRRAAVGVVLFLTCFLLRLPIHLGLDPTTLDLKGEVVASPLWQVFHILSLMVFALALIHTLMLLLVELLLVGKLKMEIPHILSDVALIAIFMLSAMLILTYKTDLNITGLFTTAGVLSIVLGLALQDTLGNIFAGLSLQTERPFKVGDWISLGVLEGVVIDVSWRSTQFRTRNNDLVTVPNSTISKESFINHSSPTTISGRAVDIGVAYRHSPHEVKRILLDACRQVPEILEKPQPLCRLKSFDPYSITYQVKFWIRDFAAVLDIEEAFRTVVWYSFQRSSIEIPYPIQVEYQHEYQHLTEFEEEAAKPMAGRALERLREVEFLAPLSEDELRTLAARTRLKPYYTNETIIREGEEGDSFFLVDQGEVTVCVSKNGRQEEVAKLRPPAPFGEMALLTGERRSATVRASQPTRVLEIDREMFKSIIVANPDLAEGMSQILARRQVELLEKRAALDKSIAAAQEEASRQILARIRTFFGFTHAKSAREA